MGLLQKRHRETELKAFHYPHSLLRRTWDAHYLKIPIHIPFKLLLFLWAQLAGEVAKDLATPPGQSHLIGYWHSQVPGQLVVRTIPGPEPAR